MSTQPDGGNGPGLKGQVMSALRWSAVAKFGGQIINWSMTLFVMRLLAPADYGLVAMLSLIFMFFGMLGDMGFGSSIVQSPTLDDHEIRQTIGAAMLVNLAICVLLIACAPLIADFYHEPRLTAMARVAALGFIASGMIPVYNGLLQREMRFKTSARIEIVSGAASNLTTLVIALMGYGAWALIWGTLVANPIRVAMLYASASKVYRPTLRFRNAKRLWGFGGNVLATRVVWYWSSQADALIAGKFLGKEALGFYSVAVHLASLPMQRAAGIINQVAFAAFAKIQHDRRAVTANTRLGIRLMALVTFPILWGIGAVSPELVHVVIGRAWDPSILPLTLVALMIPFRMIGSIVSTTIMSMGRVDVAMKTTVIGALIAPPLYFVGSRYGILGLSLAWLVTTPILFLLNLFRSLPILGLSVAGVLAELWRPLALSAAMFGAVAAARPALSALPEPVSALLLIALGAAVYLAGSWAFNRVASAEALALIFPTRFAHLRVADVSIAAGLPDATPETSHA